MSRQEDAFEAGVKYALFELNPGDKPDIKKAYREFEDALRPRTPLPWDCIPTETDYDNDENACGESCWPQDANYIVHACNAYPKLVTAINNWITSGFFRDGAKQVLKELGEL